MDLNRTEEHRNRLVMLLKSSIQFHGISEDLLWDIAEKARPLTLAAGETLYQAGDPSREIYVILNGQAEYTYSEASGGKRLGRNIITGDITGWAAMLDTQPRRPGTITCLTMVQAMAIDTAELRTILATQPHLWDVIVSRFATMVSREYALPAHYADIQKEIADLEAGAYDMEKRLMRSMREGITPHPRSHLISREERFRLIAKEHYRLAKGVDFDPKKLVETFVEAEALVDSLFELIPPPSQSKHNLAGWG